MEKGRSVTLKHLLIEGKRYIGLQFNTDKIIQALVKELPNVRWSNEYNMAYILNSNENLNKIFSIFSGVVWVNCNYFFDTKLINDNVEPMDISWFRKRALPKKFSPLPYSVLR